MSTTVSGEEDPDDFNYFAGIDAYNAAKEVADRMREYTSGPQFQTDAIEAMQSMSARMREYTSSAQTQFDAMEAARAAIKRMRHQAAALDSLNRPKAHLAVRANEDWLKAEERKRALADAKRDDAEDDDSQQDEGPAARRQADEAATRREEEATAEQFHAVEMLAMLEGIRTWTQASAQSLEGSAQSLREIRSAHGLAERRQALADQRQVLAESRQRSQEKVNSRFTIFGLSLAGISLVAAVVMPMIEHFVWDAEKEKREAARTTAPTASPTMDSSPMQPTAPGNDCLPDMPPAQFLSCLVPQR